jgi:hypothetical protein
MRVQALLPFILFDGERLKEIKENDIIEVPNSELWKKRPDLIIILKEEKEADKKK